MGRGFLPAAVLVFDSDGTGGKAPLAPAAPVGAVAARDYRWPDTRMTSECKWATAIDWMKASGHFETTV